MMSQVQGAERSGKKICWGTLGGVKIPCRGKAVSRGSSCETGGGQAMTEAGLTWPVLIPHSMNMAMNTLEPHYCFC